MCVRLAVSCMMSVLLFSVRTAHAAAAAVQQQQCGPQTFPLDMGNTHCTSGTKISDAASTDACLHACCAAGDSCETWQWCAAGAACASGFWAQPGSLARGGDLPGWPRNTTIKASEAACAANKACIGLTYKSPELQPGDATLKVYLKNSSSGPVKDSSWSRHIKASPGCVLGKLDRSCSNASDGWSSHAMLPRPTGPCDILAAAATPCVAAHSVVRTLFVNYSGPLYRVLRDSDKASIDIGSHHDGFAKTVDQDAFCKNTSCYILRIYDQSLERNHLDTSPAGGACRFPLSPVNASRHPLSVGGHAVYGAYFEGKMGYRIDHTSGVAKGETEQTIYMVTRGDHVNAGCCFVRWLSQLAFLLSVFCSPLIMLMHRITETRRLTTTTTAVGPWRHCTLEIAVHGGMGKGRGRKYLPLHIRSSMSYHRSRR
jgi:hypothetical protein